MSSTRRADPKAPLNHERYMSSPDFAELNGISATAVARRCALLSSSEKRELLWFIQGMSLREGGLRRLARELVKMFSARCDDKEALLDRWLYFEEPDAQSRERDYEGWDSELGCPTEGPSQLPLYEFLVDLCVNPRREIACEGEGGLDDAERANLRDEFGSSTTLQSRLSHFKDVVGALWEYKRRFEKAVRAEFCLTAIGRQIWKQLDDARESKSMVVIDGLEGRGKTEAVRAWCDCHLGVARHASLEGTRAKTAQFRELARVLGVGHGSTRKASEMQTGLKEALRTSKLMLVVDEAHFFFKPGHRVRSWPEMLDWIDTAVCNLGVPIALVTTPQFLTCMEGAATLAGWNFRQFRRRCKRYVRLPEQNTPVDIERVARSLLPAADGAMVKAIMGYAAISKRDLSAVGDVVREAKLSAGQDGAKQVGFKHIREAIYEVQLRSDEPWAEMERRIEWGRGGRRAALPDVPAREGEPDLPAPAPAELDRLAAKGAGLGARSLERTQLVVA